MQEVVIQWNPEQEWYEAVTENGDVVASGYPSHQQAWAQAAQSGYSIVREFETKEEA